VLGEGGEANAELLKLIRADSVSEAVYPEVRRMLAFVDHARRVSVNVPRDVSVIGCDGVLAGLSYMELASLRIPVELVSLRAVEVIASMLESPGEVEIMHESYTGTLELANSLVKREAG